MKTLGDKKIFSFGQKRGGFISVQFSSVAQSCPTLCDSMNHSTPDLPVRHQLLEFTQTHVRWVGDAIQPSHPLSSPSPPALNLSQHQSFPMSQLFASGGQSIGVSVSTSVLPINTQDWSPLEWTGTYTQKGWKYSHSWSSTLKGRFGWALRDPLLLRISSFKFKRSADCR